jgi:AcrR family transcriptional regulator
VSAPSRSRLRLQGAPSHGTQIGHPYPRSLRRRVEILKSAAAAFRSRGYHATSVDDIAQALRMTKGNLYYYFKDKEEILYVCHDHTLDLLLRTLKVIQTGHASPEGKLRAVVIAFVELMTEELHGTAAVTLDLKELSPPLRQKITAKRDRFDRAVRRIIREGIDKGVFRKLDPKFTTFAMMGGINWIPHWFNPYGKSDAAAIGVAFAEFFVAGLLIRNADSGSPRGRRVKRTPRRRSTPDVLQ